MNGSIFAKRRPLGSKVWTSALVVALVLSIIPLAPSIAYEASPDTDPELAAEMSSNWWSAVQRDIRVSEYHVTWQEQMYLDDVSAAYQAPKRVQNLRTYFAPAGPIVIPRTWNGDEEHGGDPVLALADRFGRLGPGFGEQAALERVAAQWQQEYHLEAVTIQDVTCDGCIGEGGRKGAHCSDCEIRACGVTRGVINCALCPDYACDKLDEFFGFVPDSRRVLDQIRVSLQ